MSNIVNFPNPQEEQVTHLGERQRPRKNPCVALLRLMWKTVSVLLRTAILIIMVFSPILTTILSFVFVWHLGRTLYYWETPDVHAGWDAIMWFTIMVIVQNLGLFYNPFPDNQQKA